MTEEQYLAREVVVKLPKGTTGILCEGEVYCLEHTGETTQGDLDDSHVVPIMRVGSWDWRDDGEHACGLCGTAVVGTW